MYHIYKYIYQITIFKIAQEWVISESLQSSRVKISPSGSVWNSLGLPPWEAESELLIQLPLPLEMPHPSPSAGVEPPGDLQRQISAAYNLRYSTKILYSSTIPRLAFINKGEFLLKRIVLLFFTFSDDFNDFLDPKTTGDWQSETPPSSHHED